MVDKIPGRNCLQSLATISKEPMKACGNHSESANSTIRYE